jgi:tRNA(Ile)-lysidine synthase
MIELLLDTLSPVSAKGSLLVAISGGADSVALLHLLLARQQRLGAPYHLFCGHVNHQLRGAVSDAVQLFVEDLAARYGLPILTQRVDVKGYAKTNRLSIETAGRHLRLAALEAMARQAGCQAIATGHHKDDLAETLLMRLLRGTAFSGLVGIHPVAQRNGLQWIRPLLTARRRDITAYCMEHNLTGARPKQRRRGLPPQLVRHRLLPCLQEQTCTDVVGKAGNSCTTRASAMQSRIEQKADNHLA